MLVPSRRGAGGGTVDAGREEGGETLYYNPVQRPDPAMRRAAVDISHMGICIYLYSASHIYCFFCPRSSGA